MRILESLIEIALDFLFAENDNKSCNDAFKILVWTLVAASIVISVGLCYRYRVLFQSSEKRKFHRRKALRKSVHLRRRENRIDSDFRKGFRHVKPDEFSSKLLKAEEESVTSEESQYEEYEDYDLDEASLKEMQDELPESTSAECRRFLIDSDGETREAIEALRSYLDWRQKYAEIEKNLPSQREEEPQDDSLKASGDEDLDLWCRAVKIARLDKEESTDESLPRIIRTFQANVNGKELTDDNRNVIIKLSPAQIDYKLVSDVKTYSLAVALYLDRKLDRHDARQTVTLLIDVRGGKGWPNPSPKTLLPFLNHTVHLLLEMMPERLHQAIIFPIPGGFRWIWLLMKRGIDPDTADKCRLVSGAATISSKPPIDELSEYISYNVIELMEEERLATFVT